MPTLQKTEAFTVIQCQTASSVSRLSEEYQIHFVDLIITACKVTEGNVKNLTLH